MAKRFSFLPLALSLFIAALAGPLIMNISPLLADLRRVHDERQTALKAELGDFAIVGGPSLKVPVIRSAASPRRAAGEVKVYPARLEIHIDQSTERVTEDALAARYHDVLVRMNATFEEPPAASVLYEGERLDWARAYIYWPVAHPVSLRGNPALSVGGKALRFDSREGRTPPLSYVTRATGLPEGDVTLAAHMTYAGTVLHVAPTGWQTDVTLRTDALAATFHNTAAGNTSFHWLGRSYTWSKDGTADYGLAERNGFKPREPGQFLGMTFTEPDGIGPFAVYSDRTRFSYDRFGIILRLVPAAFAIAAITLFLTRPQGVRPQAGLFLVFVTTLAGSAWLAPRIGPMAAWYVGAVISAISTLALLYDTGWRRAALMTAIVPTLWLGLWHSAYAFPTVGGGSQLVLWARMLMQPVLLGLCLTALAAAGARWAADRRAAARSST